MGAFDKTSCFHRLSSPEHGFVDVSKQILNDESCNELNHLFEHIPDSIWYEIDEIISRAEQQPSRKLVRKRKCREVVPPQMAWGYGLERHKRARAGEAFAKPKIYQCEYCPADMLSVHVYLRHLKRHREAELRHGKSRCNGCGSLFNDVIETKWHQTRCLRRTIVGNL